MLAITLLPSYLGENKNTPINIACPTSDYAHIRRRKTAGFNGSLERSKSNAYGYITLNHSVPLG